MRVQQQQLIKNYNSLQSSL